MMKDNKKYICLDCKFVGIANKTLKGSSKTEIALWAILSVVGIIYSIYRRLGIVKKCQSCGSANLMAMNSKIEEKINNQNYENLIENIKNNKL